jgi:hypothetical protein
MLIALCKYLQNTHLYIQFKPNNKTNKLSIKCINEPGMVVQPVIPATWEAEINQPARHGDMYL